jgi:VIT1/CCC1 family predicted Fe2+/Mn2+ transporter
VTRAGAGGGARAAERHFTGKLGRLRAAVLGADDGLVSTASLIVGVAASSASRREILAAGIAGLVAGAMSMAAGEYVSVSSQADSERADLAREAAELRDHSGPEHRELAGIYVARGLDKTLAREVARQLMEKDALGAHARDELGITDDSAARPAQAALASFATFALGAALPLAIVLVSPARFLAPGVCAATLLFLAALGALGAKEGGAPMLRAAARVALWGSLALAATAAAGGLVGRFL